MGPRPRFRRVDNNACMREDALTGAHLLVAHFPVDGTVGLRIPGTDIGIRVPRGNVEDA